MPNDNVSDISTSNSACSDEFTSKHHRVCNQTVTPMPKHIPFPEYPNSSELLSEIIMCLFTAGAAISQFINIYRTNWWLPNVYTKNIVNVDLINPYLTSLIMIIITRRVIYCLLLACIDKVKNLRGKKFWCILLKYTVTSVQLALIYYCLMKLYIEHSYILLFFLLYPIIIYLFIFGFQLEPFLRSSFEIDGAYFNGMPLHCCTTNATQIRDEVEVLRNDFNKRFKQSIFTSVLNAYYAGLVPCLLVTTVHYNVMRAAQHIIIVWLCAFSLCIVSLFPAKYSDILHRASLHLGHWQKLNTDNEYTSRDAVNIAEPNAVTWCKHTLYPKGSVVRHNGKNYRSSTTVTVATPGTAGHARFYRLFNNPTLMYATLTIAQAAIMIAEILSANDYYFTVEWHYLLSVSFVVVTNNFSFFKILRDYMIVKRLYNTECSISTKND